MTGEIALNQLARVANLLELEARKQVATFLQLPLENMPVVAVHAQAGYLHTASKSVFEDVEGIRLPVATVVGLGEIGRNEISLEIVMAEVVHALLSSADPYDHSQLDHEAIQNMVLATLPLVNEGYTCA